MVLNVYKGCGEGWEKEGDVTVVKQGSSSAVYFFAKGFHRGGLMTVVTTVNSISQGE